MSVTFVVDHVLLVVEGSPCEQHGGGQNGGEDEKGEQAALGLGLHSGPGSSLIIVCVR